MSFVHLHLHSQYSLLEAAIQFKSLVSRAAGFEMPAVALTDNGNMFGAIEFYFAAKDKGLNPIIGMDAYLAAGSRLTKGEEKDRALREPNRRLVLLAKNYRGYQNLCKLSSIGFQEGFYYKPRIDYEVLKEHSSDLICLTGSFYGEVPWTFLNRGEEEALNKIKSLKEIFEQNLYLEICRTGVKEWDKINSFMTAASKKMDVPLVATNDVHYLDRTDQLAQEVLICIGSNKTLRDETRFRLGSDQFYFKSAQAMRDLFHDLPEACDNTLKIAEQCQVKFKLKDDSGKAIYHLPTYPTASGSLGEEMSRLAREGLVQRMAEAENRGEPISAEEIPKYHERLDYELKVINQMGFNGYFLIVQDFIGWAKAHDVPVGPGRGSGAGSLVAYCLKITDLDPIKNLLIFERFLNPERVSMPDFDIDFCQERRGDVINYVTSKYGQKSVSQIITYGKLQARAALRDVGRVLGMTYAEVDVVAKLMPDKLGITLKEAIEAEPRLREQMEMNPQVNTMMDLAQKIEGLVRHAGIHAAGVIIADGDLIQHAPLYRGAEGENVVQYDMKHAEKIGLIKYDFLGLKTLTHIQHALKLLEQNTAQRVTPQQIPTSDPGIYELMSKGDTAGVFQFEGEGITDALKKIKPNSFADITAINALYRPGPMDMIPTYTKRKHGEEKVEYLFPELEDILKETYGIIVYQEQVQLIAAKIASYSLGEADLLRRAMGKKIPEEMQKQKARFMEGALKNGFDKDKSNELFDLMAEFANYGFNKSHAAAYCVIAAQTAWLKRYHPTEFFAALLSTEMSDTDKVVKYVKDAQKHQIKVFPPNINRSEYKFTGQNAEIYFGLGAIKGVGEAAVEAILEARRRTDKSRFENLNEFFKLVDLRKVNKKTMECLIKSGALDEFGVHRAQLLLNYPKFLDRAEVDRRRAESGQVSLFQEESEAEAVTMETVAPWARSQLLAAEKETLGFYLSDHPLAGMDGLYKKWITCEIADLVKQDHKKRVVIAGLVSTYKELITKKGTRMCFSQLEDLSGSIELITFPDVFAKVENILKPDSALLVGGILEKENDAVKIIVEQVTSLNEASKKIKRLTIKWNADLQQNAESFSEVLKKHPGPIQVWLDIQLSDIGKRAVMELKDPGGVTVDQSLLDDLYSLTTDKNFFEVSL